MPVIECARCGRKTNTALSDHINRRDGRADRCYVRLDERGELEVGCAWSDAPAHIVRWWSTVKNPLDNDSGLG